MEVFDSKKNAMGFVLCISLCGCNARLCEVSRFQRFLPFFLKKKFPARKKGGGVTISSNELKIRGGGFVIRTSN